MSTLKHRSRPLRNRVNAMSIFHRFMLSLAMLATGLSLLVAESTTSIAATLGLPLVQPRQADGNAGVFRSRDKSWDYCRIALDFFRIAKMPFAEMTSTNALIGNPKDDNSKFCFAKPGEVYLVYLPNGSGTAIDLTKEAGALTLRWFNPRDGSWLENNSTTVNGGETSMLNAPDENDWLAVIRQ